MRTLHEIVSPIPNLHYTLSVSRPHVRHASCGQIIDSSFEHHNPHHLSLPLRCEFPHVEAYLQASPSVGDETPPESETPVAKWNDL